MPRERENPPFLISAGILGLKKEDGIGGEVLGGGCITRVSPVYQCRGRMYLCTSISISI